MKRIQNPKHKEFRLNREFSKLQILDRESNKIYKPKGWRIRNQQEETENLTKIKFKEYRIQESENLAE